MWVYRKAVKMNQESLWWCTSLFVSCVGYYWSDEWKKNEMDMACKV
jgi:hypothetical protein